MTRVDPSALGTLLVVVAHPDDETYLAGGLLAASIRSGARVVCVCATAGEHGTDDPVGWPPQRLGPVRRWEAAAAMAVLGVEDHRWLDLADGSLADLEQPEPVDRLRAIIAEVRPDTIATFGPDGATFHPDHQTVSRWVDVARSAWPTARLLHFAASEDHLARWASTYEAWGIYLTEERPVAVRSEDLAIHLVLDGLDLDQKVAALAAMVTQTGPARALLGDEEYREMVAAEMFVDTGPARVPGEEPGRRSWVPPGRIVG